MASYASISDIWRGNIELFPSPTRIPVVDAVEQNMRIYLPGGSNEYWTRARTPYMIEPMNRLADRAVEGVIFVGPSRSGKTAALVDGFLVYAVLCDPGDMHIIHMTQATAQRYSQTRIARLNQHSPAMREHLSPYASDDNVFAKRYRNSMTLTIGWPSITQLSSFDLRYVALTDYDRFPEDVGREGDVFTPARKRTQTFMSKGRVLCESSPGKLLTDAKWQQSNPHEGPPCGGIFSLYNQGDRRRWYWPCPHCGAFFTAEPSRDAFILIENRAHLVCPKCATAIEAKHKPAMNAAGVWLADGQQITPERHVIGAAPVSNLASYWLTGPAAAYQSWDSLVQRYDQAMHALERTGDEKTIQALVTTDFGTAYRPRNLNTLRDGRVLSSRAEDTEKRTIPAEVRFLTAAVDVQKNRFVVQVMGWAAGNERWLIDRYNLRWSRRLGGNDEPEPIDPARQSQDWAILLDNVANKPYPLADDPTKGLKPVAVAVDSGGKAGVTERAYLFWRQARAIGIGNRIMLVKGSSSQSGPRLHKTFPDSSRRADRKANAYGEVPVWLLNTLILKDTLAADLERAESGPGYIHFPNWLGTWFFDELAAETRTAKGWENLSNDHNEAFDLCVYNHAVALMVQAEKINWDNPPAWADPSRSAVAVGADGAPVSPLGTANKKLPPASTRVSRRDSQSWGL